MCNVPRALLQRAGGKDEPNMVKFMVKSQRTSHHGTQSVMTHSRTAQKPKTMINIDQTYKPGCSRRISSDCFV